MHYISLAIYRIVNVKRFIILVKIANCTALEIERKIPGVSGVKALLPDAG